MSRLEPISIAANDNDLYLVTMRIDEALCEHRFNFYINGFNERTLNHENTFYSKTWDIPEREFLEQAIVYLDDERIDAQCLNIPAPLEVEAKGANQYLVHYANGNSRNFLIREEANKRILEFESNKSIADLQEDGRWIWKKGEPRIAKVIFNLHQTLHPKYKQDSLPR